MNKGWLVYWTDTGCDEEGLVVWLKSSHLSLVRSNKDICCDEEREGGVVKVISPESG